MRKHNLIVALCAATHVVNADTRLRSLREIQPLTDDDRAAGISTVALCDQNDDAATQLVACGPTCKQRIKTECKAARLKEGDDTSPTGSSPMSWQASTLNGLSGFIAERAKAEVINWAESLISKYLCGMTSPPVPPGIKRELWFHDTCALFGDPQLAMQKSTAMIAAAVRSDLVRIPRAIARWFAEAEAKNLGPEKVERITHDAEAAARVYESLRRGASPLEIVAGLGHDIDLRQQCIADTKAHPDRVTPECALVLAGIVVEHFGPIITSNNITTIDAKNFDSIFTLVFAGPGLCTAVNEAFGVSLPPVAQSAPTTGAALPPCTLSPSVPVPLKRYIMILDLPVGDVDFDIFKARLRQLAQAMVELEALVREVKKSVNIQALLSSTGKLEITDAAITRAADSFIALVHAALGLFDNKQGIEGYEAAVDDALEIARLGLRLASGDYTGAGATLVNLAGSDHLGIALPESFKRFLAFTMDVATAKSSDDVQHAIEMAAAPVGGWKVKHQHLSITLNAFAGAMGGYEWTTQSALMASATKPGSGLAGGLFAPVGVDIAAPFCDSVSAGIFISALDVGQLTWSRLSNVTDSTATASITPNVDFAQVVSPGAYVHLGIGNSPFVVGAGLSFAPALRSYTLGGSTTTTAFDEIRFGIFLGVDVTILPMWTNK